MSRLFGWSYPPGAANDPFAPYNQVEGPCAVCGLFEDKCICPECPSCTSQGDPSCYEKHGMTRSQEQIDSLAEQERQWAEQSRADSEAEDWLRNNPPKEEL